MDETAVLATLGLIVTGFSTLWATGGWSALRRRSIQQEIAIANGLEDGSEGKAALMEWIEQEVDIYLFQVQRRNRSNIGLAVTAFFVGFLVIGIVAGIFPDANDAVVYTFEAILGALVIWVYAVVMRALWVWWNKRRHRHLLQLARPDRADDTAPTAK